MKHNQGSISQTLNTKRQRFLFQIFIKQLLAFKTTNQVRFNSLKRLAFYELDPRMEGGGDKALALRLDKKGRSNGHCISWKTPSMESV